MLKRIVFALTCSLISIFALPTYASVLAHANGEPTAGVIKIISAEFGEFHGQNRRCDARIPVRDRCEGKKVCDVVASTELCGNPAPERQGLLVHYQCKNGGYSTFALQNTTATLDCRGPKQKIDQ